MELEPVEQYLKSFHWNKVKYRADRPLGEIIVTLQKVRGILLPRMNGLSSTRFVY